MAKYAYVELDDAAFDELRHNIDEVCRIVAGRMRDELTKEAALAIETFYADYKPKYYNRHYRNFRKNSYTKYYSKSGKWYYGGVRLTPEAMQDIYRSATPQEVFDTVYAGFHGAASAIDFGYDARPEASVPRMWPSPRQMLLNKRDELFKHRQQYINDAVKQVF